MKYFLPLISVLFVSCGEIKTNGGAGIGEVRTLKPASISLTDNLVYDSICSALTKKSQKLSSALPNALSFDVQEKDCEGKNVTFATQQVRVENNSSEGYQFRRQDTSGLFVFPAVETQDKGLMQSICSGSTTTLPTMRSTDEAMWVSTAGFSSADCPSASSEVCLLVEYGTREGTGNSFRIHTRDFVRFNLQSTSGKYGYFTHRKSFSENNCERGKNTESIATMR